MRVLAIPDPHEPYGRAGHRAHCAKVARKYRCDRIVCLGDIVDSSTISFHEKLADGLSAVDEFQRAKAGVQKWKRIFPEMDLCLGNHDARIARVAASVGIPELFLRQLPELYGTPKWKWHLQLTIDGVLYTHGTAFSGLYPHRNAAARIGRSVVIGHTHSVAGIDWIANQDRVFFGMCVGAGCDDRAIAFRYMTGRYSRSMLGCGVVIDGQPIWIPMGL